MIPFILINLCVKKFFVLIFFLGIGFYEIFDFKLLIIILNFQK